MLTKKKRILYTEVAYLLAMIVMPLGVAMMKVADLGLSMIVAPAYLIHLKVSQFLPWFSFGTAEYVLQGLLLVALFICLGRCKLTLFFSFVTALLYGLALDGCLLFISLIPTESIVMRIGLYALGMLLSCSGVALFFGAYIPPCVYDLFVKETAARFSIDRTKFKIAYDTASFLVSLVLSVSFFGLWPLEGIGIGTFVCALINGRLIGALARGIERFFVYEDRLPRLRGFFEKH